jgi:NAD-dependent aldehyde dehydrogenases
MGKPIVQSLGEIEKCVWLCEFYAKNASSYLAASHIKTQTYRSAQIHYAPLGVVLGVMPWNYPFWQVMRYLVPSLLAGNTCLLKHASNVMGCAQMIESCVNEAGMPPGVFTNLCITSSQVAGVIAHPMVHAITLTGSEGAGKSSSE